MIKHYLLMTLVCIPLALLYVCLEWFFGNTWVTVGVFFGVLVVLRLGLYLYRRSKGIRDGYLDEGGRPGIAEHRPMQGLFVNGSASLPPPMLSRRRCWRRSPGNLATCLSSLPRSEEPTMHDLPTYDDVIAAAARIAGHANRTPVMSSRTLDEELGAEVFFKCENLQRMGAFKFRGAFNALSRFSAEQRAAGVVAFSSGNHAQAIALSARLLGIPATIVMPADAPAVKIEATRGYGGLYGVEPEAGNDGQRSLRSGAIVHIDTPQTLADGAQTQHLGNLTFPLIQRNVDDILTASDAELVDGMRFLAARMKLLVEPTGCLGLAAARQRKDELRGKRVGILLSGGNVDLARFCALLGG